MNWSKEHRFWRIVFFYKSLISFLNAAKTELLWCMPPRQRDRLPNAALRVGSDSVQPVRCVRDLGIYIISDVSMRTHIMRTVSNCFSAPYSFKALGCQSVSLCCCHWLGHWYWRDSTTTAQPCLVFLATCWTVSSPFSMQLSALSVTRGSTTTSLICAVTCTGFGYQREYTPCPEKRCQFIFACNSAKF